MPRRTPGRRRGGRASESRRIVAYAPEGLTVGEAIGHPTTIDFKMTIPKNRNVILHGPITIEEDPLGQLIIGENSSVRIKDFSDE
tara:strand:- start:686 stop:940 length:255 start_codon:yes stop_codon:yes gene_type:complete